MDTSSLVPFWGCLICGNVHIAAGNNITAVVWISLAVVVMVVETYARSKLKQ